MTLPFPKASETSTSPLSARIPDKDVFNKLKSRIDYAARSNFPELKKSPQKSAALIYIGLVYLKDLYESNKIAEGQKLCEEKYEQLNPEAGGSGVNCSYYGGQRSEDVDHYVGIAGAMNIFLPSETAKKKRCIVLVSIGADMISEFSMPGGANGAGQLSLPESDDWISSYDWAPRD